MDKLNEEEFIYQKKDFVNMGIKSGSFNKVINDLKLNTEEYCITKILKNGIKAFFFNEKAYSIISQYIENRGLRNSKNELMLINDNIDLKEQNQKLQNAIAMIESKYIKEIADLKDNWHEKEVLLMARNSSLIKENTQKDKEIYEKEIEIERLKNRGFFARLFNK